jgi:endoglucanase
VQAVVNGIRDVSPEWHIILLPGVDYTAVGSFISDGSGPELLAVTNPDGSTTNLIFDVHQYLDGQGGIQNYCVEDGTDNLNNLAYWLRQNGRQA